MKKILFILVSMSMLTACNGVDTTKTFADLNFAWAQDKMGQRYQYGFDGVKKNMKRAFYWYKKAAKQNFVSSQVTVGLFYSGGLGGPEQSCEKSTYWYERARRKGYQKAWANMAWELATCEQEGFRDAKKALRVMLDYFRINRDFSPGNLDNMAAIYAQLGDFEKAINIQTTAVVLLNELGGALSDKSLRLKAFKERLELYKEGKTWHGISYAVPQAYMDTSDSQ